jgi:predicted enzyme related to lactoylglutathione lyase
MTEDPMTPMRIESILPEMPVRNLSAAVDFYTGVLGFRLEYLHGDEYAVMRRDIARVGLLRATPEVAPGSGRVYVIVSGIDGYYQSIRTAGGKISDPLDRRPYGLKDFAMTDPDGNRLAFGEQL